MRSMTKFMWTGVMVTLLAGVTISAQAQEPGPPPPGGPGGYGGPNAGGPGGPPPGGAGQFRPGRMGQGGPGMRREPSLATLPFTMLENALKLSDSQSLKIRRIREAAQEEMGPPPVQGQGGPGQQGGRPRQPGGFGGPGEGPQGGPDGPEMQEQIEKRSAMEKKLTGQIEAVLTADQRKQAAQLIKDLPLLRPLGIPGELWGDLKLTDDQRKQLQELAPGGRGAGRDNAPPPPGAREETHNKALSILTNDQREMVEKWSKEHPRPQPPMPGPDGFGGPDGGPGGPPPGGPGGPGGPPPAF